MAINYLNSLDLNKNEILQGVIENQPNDASAGSSPVEGQLYFNTTDHVLKQYNGTSWEESGGGVESIDLLNSTYVSLADTGTTAVPELTASLSAVDGTAVAATRFLSKDNTWDVPVDTNTQETYTLPVAAGTVNTAVLNLTAGGSGSGIKSVVTIAGTTDQVAISETAGNNGTVTVGLPDDVIINDTLTVVGDIAQTSGGNENVFASELNMSSQKITNVLDPTSAQDAATKQYVDDATVGGLIYQGGYNASTNVPVLDSRGTQIAVEKGWTYTVTADGTFYGEVVRAGDVLIAEVDLASGAGALANWTTVQNNVDLASLATIGIGNVNKSTVATLDGISVAYSSGTASVGLDIQGLTYITSTLATDDLQGIEIPIYNGEAATAANEKIEIADLVTVINNKYNDKDTIPIGDLAGTVTHNWNTKNTIVQTIDQNGDTVFCDITRTTTTVTATISAAQTAATGGIITILVQRIG